MRTSLIEIERIENWMFGQGDPQEKLLIEAKIRMIPEFKEKAEWQAKSYQIIQEYGRQQFKKQLQEVEKELFQSAKHKSFQQRIKGIFNF